MKKTSQYIWVTLLILAILIIDAYYQVTESPVPIWQTEWFMWRIFGLSVIIIGLAVYYLYRLSKKRNKELEMFKFKMVDAQESEWKRVAGELHDNIGQNLSAMNIFLQQNIKSMQDSSDEKKSLQAVSDMLVETLEDVRRISSKLYPQQIERLGLTIALQSMLQKMELSTGIKFSHKIDNIDSIFPRETEIYFYRIIQEALNNIIKHSKALNAEIEITRSVMFVQVHIKDDGIGFDMNKYLTQDASKLGFGLINLEDRIKLVKGTYEVQSEPEKGTLLKITVPVKLKSKRD